MRCLLFRDNIKDSITEYIESNGLSVYSQPLTGDSYKIVQCAVTKNSTYLKYCFDRIGIVYDDIYLLPVPCYRVGDIYLQLFDLSSGERDYLYALCCKELNIKFTLCGTLDRLDKYNRKKFIEDFKDYDCLIIVMNKTLIDDDYSIDIEDIVVR